MRPSTVSDKSRRREPVAARDRWTHGDPAYPIPGIDRADHGPNNRRMLAHVMSAAVLGVEAVLVRVEVDVVSGLPRVHHSPGVGDVLPPLRGNTAGDRGRPGGH